MIHLFSTSFALAAVTCWLCRPLLVPPRRPHMEEAVITHYTRLLGRQDSVIFLALGLTVLALVALMMTPSVVNPQLQDLRRATASCGQQESPYDPPTCYTLAPGGQWVVEEVHGDGSRTVIATVSQPRFAREQP